MNERIKELANQAWCAVNQRIGFNDVQRQALFEEKFAELIVQECAYINFYKRTDISLKDAYRVSKVILEHFGVEE
jgi:hypothetical protein